MLSKRVWPFIQRKENQRLHNLRYTTYWPLHSFVLTLPESARTGWWVQQSHLPVGRDTQNWYIQDLQHIPWFTFFFQRMRFSSLSKPVMKKWSSTEHPLIATSQRQWSVHFFSGNNICSLALKKKRDEISKGVVVGHSHSVKVIRNVVFFLYVVLLFWLPLDRNTNAAAFGAVVRTSLLFVCQYWYRKFWPLMVRIPGDVLPYAVHFV